MTFAIQVDSLTPKNSRQPLVAILRSLALQSLFDSYVINFVSCRKACGFIRWTRKVPIDYKLCMQIRLFAGKLIAFYVKKRCWFESWWAGRAWVVLERKIVDADKYMSGISLARDLIVISRACSQTSSSETRTFTFYKLVISIVGNSACTKYRDSDLAVDIGARLYQVGKLDCWLRSAQRWGILFGNLPLIVIWATCSA